jgi:hypothetical protein
MTVSRIAALILALMALSLPAHAQEARSTARDASAAQVPPPIFQVYVAVDGQQVGPLNEEDFKRHVGTPGAAAALMVWMPGMANWAPASTVPALQPIIASIGQTAGGTFQQPADPAAYMLGVWISQDFNWTIGETKYSAVIQMKLMPDGRFEGATLFRPRDQMDAPLRISHEKGTWTAAPGSDGQFSFTRNITYTDVAGLEIIDSGQLEDTWTLMAVDPNRIVSPEDIDFIRIPETG